ncbi:Uncharacterised protein [Salmonella enterica subsp. diarizonae]|nr:Uncharacterised protein [Salmonella enterica subsp. diarizonae]
MSDKVLKRFWFLLFLIVFTYGGIAVFGLFYVLFKQGVF